MKVHIYHVKVHVYYVKVRTLVYLLCKSPYFPHPYFPHMWCDVTVQRTCRIIFFLKKSHCIEYLQNSRHKFWCVFHIFFKKIHRIEYLQNYIFLKKMSPDRVLAEFLTQIWCAFYIFLKKFTVQSTYQNCRHKFWKVSIRTIQVTVQNTFQIFF